MTDEWVSKRLNQPGNMISLNYATMSLTSDPVVSLRPGVTTTVLLRLQPEGHGHCMSNQRLLLEPGEESGC